MMKKILILSAFCIAIGFAIFSCSKQDENLEIIQKIDNEKQKTPLNKETSNFKTDIISILKEQKTHTKGNKNLEFTAEQKKYLVKQSLKMFNSHGFRPSEFKEFLGEGDERIILMATMFVGILESESTNTSIPRVKSDTESGGDDGRCYSADTIIKCATSALRGAIGVDELKMIFAAGCFRKPVAIATLKAVGKRLGWITVGFFVYDFSACLFWE